MPYRLVFRDGNESSQGESSQGGSKQRMLYRYDKELGYIYYVPFDKIKKNPKRYVILEGNTLVKLAHFNFTNMKKHLKSIRNSNYYHITSTPFVMKDKKNEDSWFGSNNIYYNPEGLWFGCGDEWIKYVDQYCKKNPYDWFAWTLASFVYEIRVNSTVKKINNMDEFKKFLYTYKTGKDSVRNAINWNKIRKDYNGLIICPYLGEALLGKNAQKISLSGDDKYIVSFYQKLLGENYKDNIVFLSEWYRHWEAGSGVIWNNKGIEEVILAYKAPSFSEYLKKQKLKK